MGKSPTPMERQNTRKPATASRSVTPATQGRHTNDTPPNRTPGATDACPSAVTPLAASVPFAPLAFMSAPFTRS